MRFSPSLAGMMTSGSDLETNSSRRSTTASRRSLSSPQTWPVWPGIKQASPPIQRYVMDRFPYAVGYQVVGDEVVVVTVAHGKRRPGYWR